MARNVECRCLRQSIGLKMPASKTPTVDEAPQRS